MYSFSFENLLQLERVFVNVLEHYLAVLWCLHISGEHTITLKKPLLGIVRKLQIHTKLVSLLGGGFCLRLGEPEKRRNMSLKCISSVLKLHPKVRNYGVAFVSFPHMQRLKCSNH